MLNVVASGNVARDPQTNTVGGSEVCNFTILVNNKIKGEDVTSAIDCAVWGKRAEVAAKYIKKGNKVVVSGDGIVEAYEGKSGPGAKIRLNVNNFDLPPKSANNGDDDGF